MLTHAVMYIFWLNESGWFWLGMKTFLPLHILSQPAHGICTYTVYSIMVAKTGQWEGGGTDEIEKLLHKEGVERGRT